MKGHVIDLRSDTVTLPSKDMLGTVVHSPLGDSLRDEDPTVNTLQEKSAALFRKEDALLLISGTMANQVAINVWSERGTIVLTPGDSHIARKEAVSTSVISGCSVFPLRCSKGIMNPDTVRLHLENQENLLGGKVGLVSIENSANAPGGLIYPKESIGELFSLCKEFGVPLHIDGSRIFNALVEAGEDSKDLGNYCDSLTFCLSKGLGGPLGSVLVGSADFIERAKESRNILGGGMRQAGVIAACGLFALDNNIERLLEDHGNARVFAKILGESGHFRVLNEPVQTNIILFTPMDTVKIDLLKETLIDEGVLIDYRRAPVLRAVTNLNHSKADIENAGQIIASAPGRLIR